MTQASVLWEITQEGEDYLERTNKRLEESRLPGMRGYVISDVQLGNRLRILEYLKEYGSTLERDLPPFRHPDNLRERGWTGRAKIAEGAARKALTWLRERNYILAVGGG